MIYFHADDYGINTEQAGRVLDCYYNGVLNSVSIIPNWERIEEAFRELPDDVKKSVHLNLCEGHSVAPPEDVPLLVNENGEFRRSFVQLLLLSTFSPACRKQIKAECRAQIHKVRDLMDESAPLRLDSHRHYHMIPAVYRALFDITGEEGIRVEYVRWPVEKVRLYGRPAPGGAGIGLNNRVKCLVLNCLGIVNRGVRDRWNTEREAVFCGVGYTGNMFYENVHRFLDRFVSEAEKRNMDLEVLFHPGGVKEGEFFLSEDTGFPDYYMSGNRDREAEALKRLKKEREV